MKVILHIGEGKTGTTSIQQYLSSVSDSLAALGYFYLTPPTAINHVCLAARLGAGVRVSKDNISSMKLECDNLFSRLHALANQPQAKAVILSVEHIFTADPDRVLGYLQNYFSLDSIHIIAYVRDPVSQYVSRMQQRIKASFMIVPPDRYLRDVFSPVKRWVDKVGIDRVHVKPFSRNSLVASDVLTDFMSQVSAITDFDLTCIQDDFVLPEIARSNAGINVEQMSTVQCFRRIVYPQCNNVLQRRSSKVVAFFEELNSKGQLGTKPQLKPEISNMISCNNAAYIDSLANLFPQFKAIQGGDQVAVAGCSIEPIVNPSSYVSIIDLFVDRSAAVLDLYRYLCLPLSGKLKAPDVYLQGVSRLLGRCACADDVSAFILGQASSAVDRALDRRLPQVQMF